MTTEIRRHYRRGDATLQVISDDVPGSDTYVLVTGPTGVHEFLLAPPERRALAGMLAESENEPPF